MAFNPSKPVEDSPLDAAEVRDQFNALKDLIDAQQATIADLQSQFNDLSLFAGDMNQAVIQLQQAVAALQGSNP